MGILAHVKHTFNTNALVKMAAITSASSTVVARTAFVGKTESLRVRAVAPASKRASVTVFASADAEATSRRAALSLFTAGAAAAAAKPSFAAYGDSANVFGKITNTSGFLPFAGDGYALLVPAKFNPSKERPFPNQDLYYEDNFDAVTNLSVITEKTSKTKIEDFGAPEAYLEKIGYLLGVQAYAGDTRSEGGFAPNRVSTAAVLDVFTKSDKGRTYYMYEILTRTADGDEGGRHQLIAATISDGTLYTLKLQSGDKRWFKGQERDLKQVWNSFSVA